jgi:hypothetical protein
VTTIPDPQIYRAAADVIRRNGWNQGHFYGLEAFGEGRPRELCPLCLLGAVNLAVNGDPADLRGAATVARHWLAGLIRPGMSAAQLAKQPGIVPRWNDQPGRAAVDVLDLLARAATAAESALAAQDGGGSRG